MRRRTQAERTAATRDALITATLELLVESGWAGITSVAVCSRAGLTRGAFVHHFDGLPALFSAALDSRYAALSAKAGGGGPRPTSVAELVTQTWETMTALDFKVVIEAWLAAANDPTLGAAIGPVIERFAKLVHPDQRADLLVDDAAQSFFLMARETMLGLSLGRATNRGRPLEHEARVLEQLVRLADEHDARIGQQEPEP
ncbi:MAG: TetR/AcrR family transcriptional regulator [Myxococcota bacterium]|jgi:AcrR family transcriptional regulator|nr:TetR/AcrR family transcriptional regulator [Myxococcota bacterium]